MNMACGYEGYSLSELAQNVNSAFGGDAVMQ